MLQAAQRENRPVVMSTDSKKKHERAVFLEFAQAAQLGVDSESIVSPDEPKPDVLCRLDGEPVYFELGRLLDQTLPRLRLEMMRVAPQQVQMDVMNARLPERVMLEQKLGKNYDTDGVPVELLLYYDFDESNLLLADFPVMPAELKARHVWEPLLAAHPGIFRRVWVFERYRKALLWSFPPRPNEVQAR